MSETKTLKQYSADVIVCGGGVAGLPAALAAAREGMRVIVVEKGARIGGAPVNNLIQCFCGRPFHGICLELIRKMKALSQDYMYGFEPRSQTKNCFRTGDYVVAWRQMLAGLPIQIFTEQEVKRAVLRADGGIERVETDTAAFQGKAYIDATGDAALAALTACKLAMGREARSQYGEPFAPEKADGAVQRCTLMYVLRRRRENEYGPAPNWAEYSNEEYLMWGPTVVVKNPLDAEEMSEATQKAYDLFLEQQKEWEEKGFFVADVAPRLGVRETRRIVGNHVLNARELLNGVRFPDAVTVVRDTAIDPWDPDGNPFHDQDKQEACLLKPYEIPYASMVTDAVPNMVVAGRCISATHIVNSSLRVMPLCMATGQAAGIAASIASAAEGNALKIDVRLLREKLTEAGVRVSADSGKDMFEG
ncbi:MAG: FAD-dependent oxidoreductase [Clostridiales bacterium]|jgi:glycine/D-amino acid oxidase-like deaminating enzyme|nr:FAD-dependent oxidoreductase [Clostridiales bacterium]